jgi:putative transposase
LAERALNAEMDHHLDSGEPDGRMNSRNGYGRKTVLTDTGRMAIEVLRDRLATFDPQLIAKYRRRLPGFDAKVVSLSPLPPATAAGQGMSARGLSVREIRNHLLDLYGIEVSPDLISAVTDAVLDEVAAWQERPLDPVYPLVFFDALRVKVRDEGARIALRSGPSDTQARLRRGCAIRPSMSLSACGRTGLRTSSGCGSSRAKAPSSGCG